MSPKSAARYHGITLHDGWIWAEAAVRTGYLANVLSRPCAGTQGRGGRREGGRRRRNRGTEEQRTRERRHFGNAATRSGFKVMDLSEMSIL